MADANSEGDVVITDASDDAQQEEQGQAEASTEVSATEARIKELESELSKNQAILEKSRKSEKYAKQSRQQLEQRVQELEAQGDFKTKYEQLVGQINSDALDKAISEAASKAAKPEHVKAVATKLIDRSAIQVTDGVADAKAVEAAMLKAKEEFPDYFIAAQTPEPKRAAEGAVIGGFEKELAAAKTQAEYAAVLKRHGLV